MDRGTITIYGLRAEPVPEATREAESCVTEAVLEGDSRAQAAAKLPPVMGTSRAIPSTHARSGPLGSTGICDSAAASLWQGSVGRKTQEALSSRWLAGRVNKHRVRRGIVLTPNHTAQTLSSAATKVTAGSGGRPVAAVEAATCSHEHGQL